MEDEKTIETPETNGEGEVDYKAKFEETEALRVKAEADADKWKGRFKSTKADENKGGKSGLDEEAVKQMVNESVGVVKFYSNNKDAEQYQEDIEGLVAKGIERGTAFKYVIAEKDPSLLLDDAKRAQMNGNTALNGVPKTLLEKTGKDMTDEEIAGLSGEEFDKNFPSSSNHKKFYTE